MKKFYTYAIAAMALMCSLTAQAGDKFVVDGIQYEIMDDGSGVKVTESTDPDGYTGDVTIPATVKNGNVTYKVVGVGKQAFQWCEIGTVTLPNTVVIIEQYAFNASDVEKVVLGTGVEVIKNGAFSVVKSLTDLSEIPASCTTIEEGAFSMTNSLKSFTVNAENPAYKSVDGAIFTKSGKTLIAVPFGIDPPEYVIPEGTDSIGANVFNTFQGLQKITFPSTLKFVGTSAFTYCNNMVNTNDLPASLETISGSAFSSCYKLNVTIAPTVQYIGMYAFNNARTPIEIHIGPNTVLNTSSFTSTRPATTKLTFDKPETVNTIPDFCFQNARVTEIIIPEGYTELGGRAFGGNTLAKKIDLPSTMATINIAAFENDTPDTLVCRATTPPTYENYGNTKYPLLKASCQETTKLYVPDASIDLYKAANGWKDIVNVLPLSEYAGVKDVLADEAVKTVAAENYYDLNGREVAPAAEKKGLYIVRTTYTDGTVKTAKKVF